MLRTLRSVSGRPALLMDRAYERDRTRRLAVESGYEPVVPLKSNRRRLWTYDARRCRRLNRFRWIGSRYKKIDVILISGTYVADICDLLPSK